ncbi:hypothetical protein KAX02_01930 [candidate division WOR-3 bacterium]|nr:hypothetical protein [candidate division WOR-3 bacterium]
MIGLKHKLYFFIITLILSISALAGPFDPRYHTYEEELIELDSLCNEYSSIMMLDTLGCSSVDSIPIIGVKISDNPETFEDEPRVLFNGLHHAEEFVSTEVCMYLINELLSGYGYDTEITSWIDSIEIWIIPNLNPEGHNVAITGIDTIWRKNKRDNNENGQFDTDFDGVDLNRNYDFKWDIGGSTDPSSEYYRGPYPFSENETRIIRDLTLQNQFIFDICYHCARTGLIEIVYFPWRWQGVFSPDNAVIEPIADSVARRIPNFAGTGTYTPMYATLSQGGSARNWFYGAMGTIPLTIELSERCYPPGEYIDSICKNNMGGPYYLLKKTLSGSGITGHICDSLTYTPIEAEIEVLEVTDSIIKPRTSEPVYGRFYRLLVPGVYNLRITADGYEEKTIENVLVEDNGYTYLEINLSSAGGIEENEIHSDYLSITPNPFIGKTVISYQLSVISTTPITDDLSPITLNIYDITGCLIRNLTPYASRLTPYEVTWDGTDDNGVSLPSGIYFCSGVSKRGSFCKKIVKLTE